MLMKTMRYAAIIFFLLLTACTRYDNNPFTTYTGACPNWEIYFGCPTITYNAVHTKRMAEVTPFHAINIRGNFDVHLTADSAARAIILEGDTSIVGRTTVFVADHTLNLRLEEGYLYEAANRASVTIHVPVINKIVYYGPGSVWAKGLNTRNFSLVAGDRSKLHLEGHVLNLVVNMSGTASLETEHLDITDTLSVAMTDGSTLYYYNDPLQISSSFNHGGALVRVHPTDKFMCHGKPCAHS